ncbi:MAG: P-loop NTPase [Candidatus Nezhaarchaeota archaeon]|nr:P-loop NTPase [Candidatus Nezhaarchaeota archaeon]
MKIAVSGKGGVGKTFIAACIAYSLAKRGFKVLAIDADPSPNLAFMLGLSLREASRLRPISEDRGLIERKTSTSYPGVYRLSFTLDDVVEEYAVPTPLGPSLVVMGTVKSADGGCTCPANALLRSLTHYLVVNRGEAVVMDMEAGVEHLGRGTAKHVDHMLIVTDPSVRSLHAAIRIYELARPLKIPSIMAVGNKVAGPGDRESVVSTLTQAGIEVLGLVPFDEAVEEADERGVSPLSLKPTPKAVEAVELLVGSLLR